MIHKAQKIGYKVCTCNSRLRLGHFCEHGLLISLKFCRFLLFSAILLHFQCINIEKSNTGIKTNTRYTYRAYLPVTIWVYLCGVMLC